MAGNEPVGACCISDDGTVAATATASGEIQTFATATLDKVRNIVSFLPAFLDFC